MAKINGKAQTNALAVIAEAPEKALESGEIKNLIAKANLEISVASYEAASKLGLHMASKGAPGYLYASSLGGVGVLQRTIDGMLKILEMDKGELPDPGPEAGAAAEQMMALQSVKVKAATAIADLVGKQTLLTERMIKVAASVAGEVKEKQKKSLAPQMYAENMYVQVLPEKENVENQVEADETKPENGAII